MEVYWIIGSFIINLIFVTIFMRKPVIRKVDPISIIPVWHITINLKNGIQFIVVKDEEYNTIRTWLRGEGDSLFEIATDDAYLGLKRDHIVSVKAVRK